MKKNKMYAYLARRDKKGIKFLGSFVHPKKVYPTRISEVDIPSLNIDPKSSSDIIATVKDSRMEYEFFMETADSFESLRSSLRERGYSGIPSNQFSMPIRAGNINERMLVTNNSVMIRRGSPSRR